MDVLYFLKDRTQFIRQYYETAGEPFREIMQKIEAGEAPFDDLRFYPEDEPPFQAEWSQANTSLEVLGRSCVSMLSASLKLYFQTWESELGIKRTGGDKERKKYFENGFVAGYKQCFGEVLKISWADCPVVSREQLLTAIEHVELLGVWLEDRMLEARFPRRNKG